MDLNSPFWAITPCQLEASLSGGRAAAMVSSKCVTASENCCFAMAVTRARPCDSKLGAWAKSAAWAKTIRRNDRQKRDLADMARIVLLSTEDSRNKPS